MLKMDLIDKKILCELDLNSRVPMTQLAKKIHANRNVIAYRIKNLEEAGIIRKSICSINLGSLGYKTYKIYFKLHSSAQEKEFMADLMKDKRVITCIKTEGTYDYSTSVAVRTILELDDFLFSLKNKFKELIKDYLVSIV